MIAMWGADLDISEEIFGDMIHFLDTTEIFHNGHFVFCPYDKPQTFLPALWHGAKNIYFSNRCIAWVLFAGRVWHGCLPCRRSFAYPPLHMFRLTSVHFLIQ